MAQLVNVPLGTSGTVLVTESAGVLTIEATEGLAAQGISADLKLNVSAVILVNAWAASTTNASLKAILTEAGVLLAALPV